MMNAKKARDITNKSPHREGQGNSYEEIKSTIEVMVKYGFSDMVVRNVISSVIKKLENEDYVVTSEVYKDTFFTISW